MPDNDRPSRAPLSAVAAGAMYGVLAACAAEALLALAGAGELLFVKFSGGSAPAFVKFLIALRQHESTGWVVGVLVLLFVLAGGAAGFARDWRAPGRRGDFWPWMRSIGLGVTLLIVLSVLSIGGTIYELDDAILLIFDTWWFRVLLFFLACNIGLATWMHVAQKVLPNLAARVNSTPAVYRQGRLRRQLAYAGAAEDLVKILRRRGYRVAREGEFLAGRKGLLNRFGAPMSHVGFIIVLIGGFLTGLVGHEGSIQLDEGEAAKHYWPRLSKAQQQKVIAAEESGDHEEVERLGFKAIPLGFTVRCLDFQTDFHPKTQIRATFTSTLEIVDGEQRFIERVEVNRSLKYGGFTIHQNSWNEAGGPERQLVKVKQLETGETRQLELDPGWPRRLPEWSVAVVLSREAGGLIGEIREAPADAPEGRAIVRRVLVQARSEKVELVALRYVAEFGMDANREVVSKSDEPNNPALQVELRHADGKRQRQWLFQNPRFRTFTHSPLKEYSLEFVERLEAPAEAPAAGARFVVVVKDAQSKAALTTHTLALSAPTPLLPAERTPAAPPVEELSSGRFAIEYRGTAPRLLTVLGVTRNPLIPLIYAGCLMMCLGLFMAFYLPARNVLLWHRPEQGEVWAVPVYRTEQPTLTPDIERLFRAIENRG